MGEDAVTMRLSSVTVPMSVVVVAVVMRKRERERERSLRTLIGGPALTALHWLLEMFHSNF
jgi:hypothetical protein